ncbi:MAG: cation transporter [Actinobacteria bacterium]|nr:cation transporter [Actinomycetota bacterium]
MIQNLRKKAYILSVFTVCYNIIEGIVSIVAGVLSNSIALKGFGIDSFIESISGAVMIWRFKKLDRITEEEEKVEKIAQRFVAISFSILSVYILYESISKLYFKEITEPSIPGLIIIIMSIIIMPILFYLKYRTGRLLDSKSLVADSKETLACLFLSVAVLLGILLNFFYGFWQADLIAGIVIAIYLVIEGIRILRE